MFISDLQSIGDVGNKAIISISYMVSGFSTEKVRKLEASSIHAEHDAKRHRIAGRETNLIWI